MKKNLTELVFIIDRSGSMAGLESDTVGGMNSLLKKQRGEEGEALVTTVLFNDDCRMLHDRLDIKKVKPMEEHDYIPAGCTALLDAVGSTIQHIARIHRYARAEDVPERTLFVITTDGMENASRIFSTERVKKMIEHEKEKYGWEFMFLGANIDAVKTAGDIGICADRATGYISDSRGTALNYEVMSAAVSSLRRSKALPGDWKLPVEEDCKARKA